MELKSAEGRGKRAMPQQEIHLPVPDNRPFYMFFRGNAAEMVRRIASKTQSSNTAVIRRALIQYEKTMDQEKRGKTRAKNPARLSLREKFTRTGFSLVLVASGAGAALIYNTVQNSQHPANPAQPCLPNQSPAPAP